MASRMSRLEAERLAILQLSISRGRSASPLGDNSRSSSISGGGDDKMNKELKWSITNHDPLERIKKPQADNDAEVDDSKILWDNDEVSEEEHLSDDDNNEKFHYNDGSGSILPNYSVLNDETINEVLMILENQDLTDGSIIKRLEALTASERALANAKNIGGNIDKEQLDKLMEDKQKLTGQVLDLSKLDQDADSRKQKLESYQSYRKKVIDEKNDTHKNHHHPVSHVTSNSSGGSKDTGDNAKDTAKEEGEPGKDFMIPYTSAVEDKLDSEFASQLNDSIKEGNLDSNKPHSRVIQTITRGNFFDLINPRVKPKMFLVCMDFSPESIFALEWCIGTVLVDGSVLFIVCVIEENDSNHHHKASAINESQREKQRLEMLNRAKQQALNLLKLTKLQVHVVIEIIHHPIPRHLILEFIENLKPTLVVVGSKGQSAIKGVLLGSLSNYLVTKSSVPVMVVREKLKKINKFKTGSSVFANNIRPLTLSEARID